jgi:threonylcarbamoyladenosine tRNA methylthiotransferase MtaB
LRSAGDAARRRAFERAIGTTVSALVERPGLGRSEHYLPVRLPAEAPEGAVRQARIIAVDDAALIAEGAA